MKVIQHICNMLIQHNCERLTKPLTVHRTERTTTVLSTDWFVTGKVADLSSRIYKTKRKLTTISSERTKEVRSQSRTSLTHPFPKTPVERVSNNFY